MVAPAAGEMFCRNTAVTRTRTFSAASCHCRQPNLEQVGGVESEQTGVVSVYRPALGYNHAQNLSFRSHQNKIYNF